MVRLKFKVTKKSEFMGYNGKRLGAVELYPVADGSEENKAFYNATPTGKIEFGTINAAAVDALPLNAEVFVTLEVAVPKQEAAK